MANLLIEIGNTALKAAWSESMTLGKTFRYQGEKEIDFILSLTAKEKPEVLAVAAAKPVSRENEKLLAKECSRLIILDQNHRSTLERYGMPDYLSYDRAAAILAGAYLFKGKALTVFDFGTTINIDFVDVQGHYLGGNVSPGCRTRFKALNRYSKTLPLVNTPEKVPALGDSVATSIESGVISGIMFEIEGYIAKNPGNIVVFTGGDAIYFAKRMKNSIFVVCNLVLMGLALITDNYVFEKL